MTILLQRPNLGVGNIAHNDTQHQQGKASVNNRDTWISFDLQASAAYSTIFSVTPLTFIDIPKKELADPGIINQQHSL